MWQAVNRLLDRVGSRVSLAINIGLASFMGGLLTSAAGWFSGSGLDVFDLVLMFWAGAVPAALLILMGAATWRRVIIASLTKRIYAENDRINPLETLFRNHRIAIADLVPPLGNEIHGKTFVACEIVGPANIVLAPNCLMAGCSGEHIDGIVGRDDAIPYNALLFIGCTFRDCKFFKLTFVVTRSWHTPFSNWFPGVNWITEAPSAGQAAVVLPERVRSSS